MTEQRAAARSTLIRRLALALVGLCLIQFIIGMGLNLFVNITRQHPGATGSDYFGRSFHSVVWSLSHGGLLAFHTGLGILVLVAAVSLAVATFKAPQLGLRSVGVAGALAVLASGYNGADFLDFNEDFSSMLMAVLFAIAVFCFSLILARVAARAPGGLPQRA